MVSKVGQEECHDERVKWVRAVVIWVACADTITTRDNITTNTRIVTK